VSIFEALERSYCNGENNVTLESTDLEQALSYFDRTRKSLAEATSGLSEAQWSFRPAADRWSIAENVEHLANVHERVYGILCTNLEQAPAPDPNLDCRIVDRIIFEQFTDGSGKKAKSPEAVVPLGRLAPEAALERIARNYDDLARYVESTPNLRGHVVPSPPLKFITSGQYEVMDGYQLAITVAAHDERHLRQIGDIKAATDYPRE
jgi:hypothetical protein